MADAHKAGTTVQIADVSLCNVGDPVTHLQLSKSSGAVYFEQNVVEAVNAVTTVTLVAALSNSYLMSRRRGI